MENGCYAIKWYEGQPVPNYLCGHIDHSVDLTDNGEGDDVIYYITHQMINMIVREI